MSTMDYYSVFIIAAGLAGLSLGGNNSKSDASNDCMTRKEILDLLRDIKLLQDPSFEPVLQSKATKGSGRSTYVHWGRASCSKGSTMVYTGYVGGSYYNYNSKNWGGPANFLCLPREPIYAENSPGKDDISMIYGAEYWDPRTSPNFKRLKHHDAPCAVCQTRGESVIMIPARNKCYPGWKVKYWGYLMSDHRGDTASEYICVDRNAEPTTGGKKMVHGRLLCLVESRCGALPCPPYKDYQELTCVVCSN